MAYREPLLPLNGAGCIILWSCSPDVLLWHCQLDKEVLSSTQQDAMHNPEFQEPLMRIALGFVSQMVLAEMRRMMGERYTAMHASTLSGSRRGSTDSKAPLVTS